MTREVQFTVVVKRQSVVVQQVVALQELVTVQGPVRFAASGSTVVSEAFSTTSAATGASGSSGVTSVAQPARPTSMTEAAATHASRFFMPRRSANAVRAKTPTKPRRSRA